MSNKTLAEMAQAYTGRSYGGTVQTQNGKAGVGTSLGDLAAAYIGPDYRNRLEQRRQRTVMEKAETEARKKARQQYIYADTDLSKFTYQTVAEYDAAIADLNEQIDRHVFENLSGIEKGYLPEGITYSASDEHLKKVLRDARKRLYKADDFVKETGDKIDLLNAERVLMERSMYVGDTYGNLKNNADYTKSSGVTRHDDDQTYIAVNLDNYYTIHPQQHSSEGWVDDGYVTLENMEDLAESYGWSNDEATRRLAIADELKAESDDFASQIAVERKAKSYDFMTAQERSNYNYLYNTAGAEAAKEYLDDLKTLLQKRYTAAQEWDAAEDFADDSDVVKVLKNAATVPANHIGTMLAGINDLSEAADGDYSPYGYAHSLQTYADVIRSETAQDIYQQTYESTDSEGFAKLLSKGYQAGMSAADAVVGGLALGKGYLVVAGTNAAVHKAKELYESGAEGWQIAAGAVMSGTIEVLMEKIPLEKLLKMGGGTKGLKQLVYNMVKQSVTEGAEEGLTEVANIITDCIIQGGNSDLSRQIAAYERQGYTAEQAKQMAARDKITDLAWAAAGGMMSGGPSAAVFSGVGMVQEYQQTVNIGKAYMQDATSLQTAIGEGLSTPRATQAHKQAAALAQRVEAGKSASPYRVGQMVLQTAAPETRQAVALAQLTRQSAAPYAVNEQTVETVADIAAGTGRQIVFGNLPTAEGDNTVGGQYDPQTGVITINPDAATDQVVEFLTKHELTHSVQDTHQWEQLADIVEAQMGDDAWSAAIAEEM